MSPITMGRAKVRGASATELGDRTTALSLALFSGAEELDGTAVEQARRVLDRAQERSAITGDHTVVALAGATGSGKSSMPGTWSVPRVTAGRRSPTGPVTRSVRSSMASSCSICPTSTPASCPTGVRPSGSSSSSTCSSG